MSTRKTQHFNFDVMGPGDRSDSNGYKFGLADRDLMDQIFYLLMNHVHDGATLGGGTLSTALDLELNHDAGVLPAGRPIYYKYTLVDAQGVESTASPETFVVTPAPIDAPSAPTSSVANTGGSLLPGAYSYVLSAYTDVNTLETKALSIISVNILVGTATNLVTLTLPALPAGADGFNVYRRKPGASSYHYLDTVDMSVPTPPTTWDDDGTIAEDCDRAPQQTNQTNAQNSVIVTLPGAIPTVPEGYTWKLYRTLTSGTYPPASLVHHVVEETFEGSGIITPTYTDPGTNTTTGTPPTSAFNFTNPEQIELTDGAEIQGSLPPANAVYPFERSWVFPGTLETKDGEFPWSFPFDVGLIRYVHIHLGRDSFNSGDDVIVDMNKLDMQQTTPSWESIFDDDELLMPHIVDGEDESDEMVPTATHLALFKGDRLVPDLIQVGGGATPTDENLIITVVGWVFDLTATSIVQPS